MDATKYFAYDICVVIVKYCPRAEGCDARTEEPPKVDGPLHQSGTPYNRSTLRLHPLGGFVFLDSCGEIAHSKKQPFSLSARRIPRRSCCRSVAFRGFRGGFFVQFAPNLISQSKPHLEFHVAAIHCWHNEGGKWLDQHATKHG